MRDPELGRGSWGPLVAWVGPRVGPKLGPMVGLGLGPVVGPGVGPGGCQGLVPAWDLKWVPG